MVAPFGSVPASCMASSPAIDAVEASSANTPLRAMSRKAARICRSVTAVIEPPDSSAASTACGHEAGFPMRIAVAIVLGLVTRSPRTIGDAPAAWKPCITGNVSMTPSAWYSR